MVVVVVLSDNEAALRYLKEKARASFQSDMGGAGQTQKTKDRSILGILP